MNADIIDRINYTVNLQIMAIIPRLPRTKPVLRKDNAPQSSIGGPFESAFAKASDFAKASPDKPADKIGFDPASPEATPRQVGFVLGLFWVCIGFVLGLIGFVLGLFLKRLRSRKLT